MLSQVLGQRLGVPECFFGRHFELGTDAVLDDFIERRGAIGSLPENGRGWVQREQRRSLRGHDQHFFSQLAGRDSWTARDIEFLIRHCPTPIISQTRASGTKVSL